MTEYAGTTLAGSADGALDGLQEVGAETGIFTGAAVPVAAVEKLNWPLLSLVFLIPLQNIYLGKIPSLGEGINILNILMVGAYIAAPPATRTEARTGITRCLWFMVFSYLVSLCVASSYTGWDSNTAAILKDTFFSYLFFFVTYKSITGRRSLKAIFWATVLPLPYMFKVFYTNLSWMGFSTYKDKLRLNSGTFMHLGSNEIAAFYASYVFILLSMALHEEDKKKRWFLYTCIGMNVYSLIYGFSRGAYLAAFVGVTVFCLLRKKVKVLLSVIALCLALLLVGVDLFPKAVSERFNSTFAEEEERDESAQSRIVLWNLAIDKFESSPLLGIGFNNFKKMNEYGKDTHNYYVKLLAENGLLGLGVLLFFLRTSLRRGVELFKTTGDPVMRSLAIGFLSALAAIIVGNLFGDRFTHYPLISYFYVYLAMVVKTLDWSRHEKDLGSSSH